MKEYGTNFKPDYIIFLYSETNDMHELKIEKDTFLINYLDNFSQNLIGRNDEILQFFGDYEKVAYGFHEEKLKSEQSKFTQKTEEEIMKSEKTEKIEIIKDFFELQKLKNIFSSKSFYFNNDNTIDKKLFTRVLKQMKLVTAEWDGKFIVVYLPDWNRFNSKYSLVKFFHKKKNWKDGMSTLISN